MDKITATAALKQYFGFRDPQFRAVDPMGGILSGMQDFARELKELTPEDKAELGAGAAKELGKELADG